MPSLHEDAASPPFSPAIAEEGDTVVRGGAHPPRQEAVPAGPQLTHPRPSRDGRLVSAGPPSAERGKGEESPRTVSPPGIFSTEPLASRPMGALRPSVAAAAGGQSPGAATRDCHKGQGEPRRPQTGCEEGTALPSEVVTDGNWAAIATTTATRKRRGPDTGR